MSLEEEEEKKADGCYGIMAGFGKLSTSSFMK